MRRIGGRTTAEVWIRCRADAGLRAPANRARSAIAERATLTTPSKRPSAPNATSESRMCLTSAARMVRAGVFVVVSY